jgi:hypothetical protein
VKDERGNQERDDWRMMCHGHVNPRKVMIHGNSLMLLLNVEKSVSGAFVKNSPMRNDQSCDGAFKRVP